MSASSSASDCEPWEVGDQELIAIEQEPFPKRVRFCGAFQYKTKFNKDWQRKWPFVLPVPGSPHSFKCSVCSKTLSCGHQGVADVRDHISTRSHLLLAKGMATQSRLSFAPSNQLADKVSHCKLEFSVSIYNNVVNA